MIEELSLNGMEQVSGGGVIQRLKCLVGKHDWDVAEWSGYYENGTFIYLWHYICSGCKRCLALPFS